MQLASGDVMASSRIQLRMLLAGLGKRIADAEWLTITTHDDEVLLRASKAWAELRDARERAQHSLNTPNDK
jgi:uncharacterized phage protein gp47/JayE